MSANSDFVFVGQQAVMAAVPLVLAGMGELVAERAGVINVGIEGLMLVGCLAGYAGAAASGSGLAGVGLAGAAGMGLAAVFAGVCVWLRGDQIVAGTAVNMVASGVTTTAWAFLESRMRDLPAAAGMSRMPLGALARVPEVGPILFNQYALCYVVGVVAVLVAVMLRKTRMGLIVRALGDAPEACDAAGVGVRPWRTGAILFAGLCAGVAGSYLSIMRNHSFSPDMTGGQGFLVLALVIFGRWNVGGLILGCLAFGAVDSLQQFLQASDSLRQFMVKHVGVAAIPYPLFRMLPYVAALGALAVLTRGRGGPSHLGRPWPEEK